MRSLRFSHSIRVLGLLACLSAIPASGAAETFDFEDLALNPESEWHGPDPYGTIVYQTSPYEDELVVGKFTSRGADFNNVFSNWYGSWTGWAYSNKTYNPNNYMPGDYNPGDGSNGNPHPVPTGWTSQYHAVPGGNAGASPSSANYALGYVGWDGTLPTLTFSSPTLPQGAFFSNNNYAYYTMMEGDPPGPYSWAQKFTSLRQDYMKLIVTGKDAAGVQLGAVDFYLADFRDPAVRTDNPKKDNYILDQWAWVDLSSLGASVKSLEFGISVSDYGAPTYFTMDNLATGPKPLWTGTGDNKWSNAANWTSAATPGSGQNILFTNNTNTNINLDGNQYIANITFDTALAGSFTLNNNTLTPDAGGSITVTGSVTTSQTINSNLALVGNLFLENNSVSAGQSLNIAGNIQSAAPYGKQNLILSGAGNGLISGTVGDGTIGGTLGLEKQGSGLWTLSNNAAYSGDTSIQDGVLQLNGPSSNLHLISGQGDLAVGDGLHAATLTADSIAVGTLTIAAGATVVINPIAGGPLSGSYTLSPVPEPSTFVLLAIAALGLLVCKARQMIGSNDKK